MNIFDLLKLMNLNNNNGGNLQNNPSFNNFPQDSFSQNSHNMQNNSLNGDNLLPLLMSLMGKNTDISKIFTQNTNKEEVNKESTSPKDEILL